MKFFRHNVPCFTIVLYILTIHNLCGIDQASSTPQQEVPAIIAEQIDRNVPLAMADQSVDTQILLDSLEEVPVKITAPGSASTRDGSGGAPQTTPSEVLGLLYQANLNTILSKDFFTCTYPLAYRIIQTYPAVFAWTPEKSSVTMRLFYQQTTNEFPTCMGIKGYINLFNPDFIQAIDLPIVRDSGVNVPDLIALMQNARVEQRRVGFLFDGWNRFHGFTFGASLPLYVVERNYNLPIEDQHEIRSQNILSNCNSSKAQEQAFHKYAVETRFGIGDLQLNLAYDAINTDQLRWPIGIRITAPTASTIKAGFIGSDFKKCDCRSWLDFTTLIEAFLNGSEQEKEQAKNTLINFGQCWANHMGAMLLATDLGLEKRWQCGLYTEPTYHFDDKVSLTAQVQFGCWQGKKVERFFKEVVDCALFANNNFDPDKFPPARKQQMSQEAIDFLQNRLTNDLFPCQYCTTIRPQWEGQLTIGPWFKFTDNWSLFVGYDWWHRSKECATLITHKGCCPTVLQKACGLQSALTQNKMVVKGQYIKPGEHHDFALTLAADISMTSHGIASDYTGTLAFAWSF